MSQSETIVGLGARTDYLAQVPNVDPSRLGLTPEEDRLFLAVGRAARIDEVIQKSGMAEPRAIAVLLSLRAKGAVVPARVQKPSAVAVDAAMSEEVDLTPERKKEILDLERALDKLNAFELLGLMPGATAEQARQAYYAASRRYHPDRYYGKNLGSFKYRIDKIFKKLTDAYNTLSDDERRAEYLKKHPELAPPPPPPPSAPAPGPALDPARLSERRARMARHPYLAKTTRVTELVSRARAHIQRGEPGMALTDLHLALQLDPDNKDIQLLQAEARRKNDALRAAAEMEKGAEAEAVGDVSTAMARYRAAASIDTSNARAAFKAAQLMQQLGDRSKDLRTFAQRAVDLDPKHVDAKVLLGMVLLDADLKKLAKRQFEEALQLKPDHAEAKKQLKKLRWPF
ncbi:MAG: DnaJ domain-containing protein [Myxococcaceae bacterium]|nr:DnaJ domain-containing protein [Myxococcaceae bacterium]